jgi:hypothetical protein
LVGCFLVLSAVFVIPWKLRNQSFEPPGTGGCWRVMTTGIAIVDFYVSLWEDNTCGADWYYHCCRFKFRFHRIIVSLVAYGTEVGRVLKIFFFFFFFFFFFLWRGFEKKAEIVVLIPAASLYFISLLWLLCPTAASGVLLFFFREEKGVGKGREELSGCVCVCLVFAKMFLLGLISWSCAGMIRICRILLFVQMIFHSEEGLCCWGFVDG